MQRRAVSQRLGEVIYYLARVATMHDPASKARYKSLRAKRLGHAKCLRTVGDRLLLVSCSLLKKESCLTRSLKKCRKPPLPDNDGKTRYRGNIKSRGEILKKQNRYINLLLDEG